MIAAFPTLERLGEARFAIAITPDLAVGPPGHAYLFGGATLALALEVAAAATGRPVVQGTLQFVSFTPLGAILELDVETLQAGRTLAQVRVTGSLEGRILFHAGVVLGQREGFIPKQWIAAPAVPPPEACPPCTDLPPQDANAHFLAGIEVREAGGRRRCRGAPFYGYAASIAHLSMWQASPCLPISYPSPWAGPAVRRAAATASTMPCAWSAPRPLVGASPT